MTFSGSGNAFHGNKCNLEGFIAGLVKHELNKGD